MRCTYVLIFSRVEYIQLAIEHKPDCNLGQGFPDFPAPPEYLPKYIAEVTEANHLMNQYTRGFVRILKHCF